MIVWGRTSNWASSRNGYSTVEQQQQIAGRRCILVDSGSSRATRRLQRREFPSPPHWATSEMLILARQANVYVKSTHLLITCGIDMTPQGSPWKPSPGQTRDLNHDAKHELQSSHIAEPGGATGSTKSPFQTKRKVFLMHQRKAA